MLKKLITKIEGEANLKIYGDSVVDFVEIEFFQFRGIENYLKNRHFLDAVVINPRICGICGHSHLIATAKAIENAFDAKISTKAKIIREVTLNLEIIENHIKWFYITLFPTQIKDKSYLFKALEYSKNISKTIAIIAGQYPHNSYALPGGVTCDITNLELVKIKNSLLELYEKFNLFEDIELFFQHIPKEIGKSVNRFLTASNCDISKIKDNSTNYQDVTYNGEYYEVGPLARMVTHPTIDNLYQTYQDSIYTRIYARILEAHTLLQKTISLIDTIDLSEPSYIKPTISNSKGYSIIEAPRGILIHQIEIINEKIDNYNIIVPTQFNLSNGTKENPSPAQKAIMGEKIEYVDTIFKCFDICAVCVGH